MKLKSLAATTNEHLDRILVGGSVLGVSMALGAIAFGIDYLRFDTLAGILTVLVLALGAIPVFHHIAKQDEGEKTLQILFLAFFLKFVFTLVRYFFITVIYSDNGDAGIYSSAGSIFLEEFRQGNFVTTIPYLQARGAETERIALLVGVIYVFTGVSRYAASFVFSALCFSGQLLMYLSFKRAVPTGDSRRYLLLVLFLPSLLFWPSSVGKEALMLFAVGVASYGASHLLSSPISARGIPIFAVGGLILFFVRPHMSLIAIVSLGVAGLVRTFSTFDSNQDKRGSLKPFLVSVAMLLVLIGGASVATTQLASALGAQDEEASLTGVLERTASQTTQGGSAFDPPAVSSPLDLPWATVTVLFRPFPWESRSINSLISAAEGVLLFALFFISRRRLKTWAKSLIKYPFLTYTLTYSLTFVVAFSYIGNFGILARQRTQMLPLILVALAMPVAKRSTITMFGRKRTSTGPTSSADDRSPALVRRSHPE